MLFFKLIHIFYNYLLTIMNQKVKDKTKNNHIIPITPEELGRKYFIGDTEIIIKNVIDSLIQLTINQISVNHVESLERAYILRKTYDIYNRCTNMALMNPQKESELIDDEMIMTIPTPTIDTWASNKTNILNVPKQQVREEIERRDSIQSNKFKSLSTNKKKEKRKILSSKKSLNLKSSTTNSFKTKIKISHETFKTGIKKVIKEMHPVNFHPQHLIETTEKEEEVDELEELRDRALRTYFKERELEKQRKIKLEQETEEYLREEEKKKKKMGNEDYFKKPYFYNNEGKLEYIKVPDLENVKIFDNPSYLVQDGEEKQVNDEFVDLVRKTTINLFEQETDKIDKSKISKPEPIVMEKKNSFYFQPDPLESHKIEKGVTMNFYDDIIKGGEFPEIHGRLTNKDFNEIVKKFKPKQKKLDYLRVFEQDYEKKENELNEPIEEVYDEVSLKKKSNTNLINFMTNEDYLNFKFKNKLKKEYKSLEFLSPKKKLQLLKQILEEKKKKEKELKKEHSKITKYENFQYDLLEKINDERIYENQKKLRVM